LVKKNSEKKQSNSKTRFCPTISTQFQTRSATIKSKEEPDFLPSSYALELVRFGETKLNLEYQYPIHPTPEDKIFYRHAI
jgi:hypothetical protein